MRGEERAITQKVIGGREPWPYWRSIVCEVVIHAAMQMMVTFRVVWSISCIVPSRLYDQLWSSLLGCMIDLWSPRKFWVVWSISCIVPSRLYDQFWSSLLGCMIDLWSSPKVIVFAWLCGWFTEDFRSSPAPELSCYMIHVISGQLVQESVDWV